MSVQPTGQTELAWAARPRMSSVAEREADLPGDASASAVDIYVTFNWTIASGVLKSMRLLIVCAAVRSGGKGGTRAHVLADL